MNAPAPAASFAGYHTYAFKDVHGRGEFQMKRVEAALDKTLQARGLSKVDGKPDLWVVLHTKLKNDNTARNATTNITPNDIFPRCAVSGVT